MLERAERRVEAARGQGGELVLTVAGALIDARV